MSQAPETHEVPALLPDQTTPGWTEALLREIAEGTASSVGTNFFTSLVQHVAQALEVKKAFVTECTDMTNTRVRKLASFKDGAFANLTEYDVAGAPCERVVNGQACFYPRNLRLDYPQQKAESYIGLPLVDSSSRVIGHLVVEDDKPMRDETSGLDVLRIFAARAAAELERQRTERALRDSEVNYRLLFERAPLPVLVIDLESQSFLAVNDAALRDYGYSPEEFLRLNVLDICRSPSGPTDSPDPEIPAFLRSHQHVRKDGSVREVEITWHRLSWNRHAAALVLVSDVTERRKLEAERAQTMQLLEQRVKSRTRELERRRQVAESLRDVLAILNSARDLGDILEVIVSQSARQLRADAGAVCGLSSAHDGLSLHGAQGLERTQRALLEGSWFRFWLEQATRERLAVPISDVQAVFPDAPAVFRAGLVVPIIAQDEVQACLALLSHEPRDFFDEEVNLAATFADHAALALENARLRESSGKMAVMEERERLSRELHDSVTQSLYSLVLFAETGRRMAEQGQLDKARDHLRLLGETAQQTLKEMRLMLHELRPAALEAGLMGALRRRLDAVEERSGVMTRLLMTDHLRLEPNLEEGIFLIAQEALNNSLRHARASAVTVKLEASGHTVRLEVEDDGLGCDVTAAHASGGIGLTAMRERAEKLGGRLELQSNPGTGTRVQLLVPLA